MGKDSTKAQYKNSLTPAEMTVGCRHVKAGELSKACEVEVYAGNASQLKRQACKLYYYCMPESSDGLRH